MCAALKSLGITRMPRRPSKYEQLSVDDEPMDSAAVAMDTASIDGAENNDADAADDDFLAKRLKDV